MEKDEEIVGIGTDIELVERFNKLPFDKNKDFYRNIFTDEEIEECLAKPCASESFAVRFAGKEAVIKGAGAIAKLSFKDIQIRNGKANSPEVKINNKKDNFDVYISLSHTKEHALAFAIILTEKSWRKK